MILTFHEALSQTDKLRKYYLQNATFMVRSISNINADIAVAMHFVNVLEVCISAMNVILNLTMDSIPFLSLHFQTS